jgi:pimeloyl-ACP methyl ester carboxylesterase
MLPPALDAQRFSFDGLNCYVAGQGKPLLLVHSVNAAASAAEVRPLFEHAQATRTVYALDLPGYGHSERRDRSYTPRLMTDALHAVAAQIRQRSGTATPLDALAVSLSCEYLARAASEHSSHWGRLALVSPTGFNGTAARRGAPGSTRAVPGLHRLLSVPLWGPALFRQLTKPKVVRYFLERTWGGKDIDETMYAYAVRTARMPGAHHAPLHFLGGGLFSADIHTVYTALRQPVWASHGVRGDFTDYRGMKVVQGRRNWTIAEYATGAMPYFEVPHRFCADWDAFLNRASPA